jgi:hypothetical protein|nr:MAG TPA: hypothetical protein [Caudoviricetes sp.]
MVNTVDIKVGKVIRAWIVESTGSDTITVDKKSNLWGLVKQNLDLLPADYEVIQDRSEYISIALLAHGSDTKKFDAELNKTIEVNTVYRCYISERGQASIARFFENQLRSSFIVFMVARFSDDSGNEKIVHAITAFLQEYNLPINSKILSRLMKYWYRYRVNFSENNKLPIFF